MRASSSSRVPSPRARCPVFIAPGLVALTAPLSFLAAFRRCRLRSLGSHRLVPCSESPWPPEFSPAWRASRRPRPGGVPPSFPATPKTPLFCGQVSACCSPDGSPPLSRSRRHVASSVDGRAELLQFLDQEKQADVQHRKWGPDTSVGGRGLHYRPSRPRCVPVPRSRIT